MSLNIYKPIDNPQHISILFPTRNRPHYLKNLFDSLEATTAEKNLVDLWIYIDKDDSTTRDYLQSGVQQKYSFEINYVVGDRTKSQGEMSNILREKCTANPGIYMIGGDKLLFLTKNWDKIVRETFNRYTDRIVFAYARDSHHEKSFGAYGFVSAEWTNVTGRFLTEYFPYWVDDLWINQVASMIQRKIQIDVELEMQGGKGKTARLRNWLFWKRFLNNTLYERIEEAQKLIKAIYPEKNQEFYKSVEERDRLVAAFRNDIKNEKQEEIIALELQYGVSDILQSKPDENYLSIERQAVNKLKQFFVSDLRKGHIFEAINILVNILGSHHYFKEYEYKRVVYIARFRFMLCRCYRALRQPTKYPEYIFRIYRWLKQRVKTYIKLG